ncbi:MAG: lysoplasmalogenase family protein [Rhizobiaceae bacterium]
MMLFPGGIEAPANATLVLSVAAATIYGFVLEMPPSWRRSAVKVLAVALLAVLATMSAGPWMLVAGLAASAAGDAFLSRKGEAAFLAGLASFLAAHLFYIALFSLEGAAAAPFLHDVARAVVVIAMALGALGMVALLWPLVGSRQRFPVLIYAAAIFVMWLAALTLNSLPILVGAVLFMISDGLLATERFMLDETSRHRGWMRVAVWLTYYTAQLLIALAYVLKAA